ncbi:MAG: DUF6168 family protein, partial [Winogradskyella sp.]
MIRSISIYIVAFALVFFTIHFTQNYILNTLNESLRFSHWDTNVFLCFVSLLICVHFLFFARIKSLKTQLGFIYLPT